MTPNREKESYPDSSAEDSQSESLKSVATSDDQRQDTDEDRERDVRPADGETGSAGDQTQYLIGHEYDDRAERRRVEYRMENWEGRVEKVPRMTRIVEGEDFYALYRQLRDTVDDPENLTVYEMTEVTSSTDENTVRIDRVYDIEYDRLEWALQSLLDKPQRSVTQRDETTYEIHSEVSDAPVILECHLMDVQRGARLELTLSGQPPAPNAVKDAMKQDLGYLLPEPLEVFDA